MAEQRRALVTGATRGIGKAIALELARAGFDLAFTGRTENEGEGFEEQADGSRSPLPGSLAQTEAELRALGAKTLRVRLDLLDRDSVQAGARQIQEGWGGVDLLVNNAMYEAGRYTTAWIQDTPLEEIDRKIEANFRAPVALTQAFLPGMLERGAGCVINLSTRAYYAPPVGPPGRGGASFSYVASKAALSRLAPLLAVEHGRDGILAFDVDPGPVHTERAETSMERMGYPAELFCPLSVPARVVAWLASEAEAGKYNGQHFMAQEFALARGLHDPWPTILPMNPGWSPTAVLDWQEGRVD